MGDADINSNLKSTFGIKDSKDYIQKLFDLKIELVKDLYANDAKWSLFVAAASSYRYESLLKTLPSKYQNSFNSNSDDIELLNKIINETSSLQNILNDCNNKNYDNINPDVIELIHWILIDSNDFQLRTITEKEKEILFQKYFKKSDQKPSYIFEICKSKNSNLENNNFKKENSNIKYGFYGNKIDCFYSILHENGLSQHVYHNELCNDGILLTKELSNSLYFSPLEPTWGGSCCGELVSCIALCEYIEDKRFCHSYIIKKCYNTNHIKTLGKCVIINNDEIIRVRYLLFYTRNIEKITNNIYYRKKSLLFDWLTKHKCFLSFCFYALLLTSIGFINSGGSLYLNYLIKKISTELIEIYKNYF